MIIKNLWIKKNNIIIFALNFKKEENNKAKKKDFSCPECGNISILSLINDKISQIEWNNIHKLSYLSINSFIEIMKIWIININVIFWITVINIITTFLFALGIKLSLHCALNINYLWIIIK